MASKYLIRYILRKNFKISNVYNFLFKRIKRVEVKNIVWLDQFHHPENILHTFMSERKVLSYSPKGIDNKIISTEVIIPQVNLYAFDDVILNTRSSHIIQKNTADIIFERLPSANIAYCNYATGFIRHHNDARAVIKYKAGKLSIDKALFLGGNGVFNYYHWLVEIIPKVLLLTPDMLFGYGIDTLILDKAVESSPSLCKALDLLLAHQGIHLNIVYAHHGTQVHVKKLFYINCINNVVFNAQHKLSSPTFSAYDADFLKKNQSAFFKAIKLDISQNSVYPKKIFLARKNTALRDYNQSEIISYFENKGFVAIYLEDFDFTEQIKLFNQADFIVGPSGASWSNIIFCHKNVKAISWLPQNISEFSVFSSIAHHVGCDLRFIFTNTHNANDIHSSYHVDMKVLTKAFEQLQE